MSQLILKPGREKALLRHHPWIYSGAIAEVKGDPAVGQTVDVFDAKGNFKARGAYSPESQIRVRVWTFREDEVVDEAFFRRRLQAAINFRQYAIPKYWPISADRQPRSAVRLVHAESDGIPGLIVDRYNKTLVIQLLAAGVEYWRDTLTDLLMDMCDIERIFERSDVGVRKLEALPLRAGIVRGSDLSEPIRIEEHALHFWVDVVNGHKTGFYLDQYFNRKYIRVFTRDLDVLDCFSYTGGFALNALVGGAKSVVCVESSAEALHMIDENLALNDIAKDKVEPIQGDVFQVLRRFRDQRRTFDMIVLDPPKFAPTSAQAKKAARGYKDINLLAFKLLRPGGLLATFSCSGGVSAELFQKIVAGAALDAGVEAKIVDRLSQSPDHPVSLSFPEGAYLKGLIINV